MLYEHKSVEPVGVCFPGERKLASLGHPTSPRSTIDVLLFELGLDQHSAFREPSLLR